MRSRFEPKLIQVFREGYSFKQFPADFLAGIITGIVALPLAIAFAIASGVSPDRGLYTAIIAGFIISTLSGSRVQIGGPTGAFIVVVYSIVNRFGYDGLVIATIMAGAILLVMGISGLGSMIKYIPYPVTIGFTAGIAAIIAVTQLRDLLGLHMNTVPSELPDKIIAYAEHIHTINPWTLLVSSLAIIILILWPRVTHRIPGSIVAIIVLTLVVILFKLPVETIGSRFGEIPNRLQMPHLPHTDWQNMIRLFPSAVTIALLAGIESLLSAVVADGMTGGRHRSNTELIAQGIANIITPLCGGIPATGAIARTATNIKNGGRTPIAGMIHAVVLLLILLIFGKWVTRIPMAVLAAVLLVVAYNMGEWHVFAGLLKCPRSDRIVLLSTFLLTVFLDLTVAIEAGIVLAALLFMRRMEQVSSAAPILRDEEREDEEPEFIYSLDIPQDVEVFEINGPFFFGAANKFQDAISGVERAPAFLILRMRNVPALDATGLHALSKLHDRVIRNGTILLISGIQPQPRKVLNDSGLARRIGPDRFFDTVDQALQTARNNLSL